jgi:hypothetical protein
MRRGRQRFRGADEDQPGFLAPGDDFDREAERGLGLRQNEVGIARDAHRVGSHRSHLLRSKTTQPLAKTAQGSKRALLRGVIEDFLRAQPEARRTGSFRLSSG